MRILSPQAAQDIEAGRSLRLDLGCGHSPRPGYYGVDLLPLEEVAIQADLNEPLDLLPDNSVAEIYSYHCLEHVERLLPLMRELYRVLQPGARAEVYVPHFSNPYYYSDPTHVRPFGLYTLNYFCDQHDQQPRTVPSFYTDVRFRVDELVIHLLDRRLVDKLLTPFLSRIINRSFAWQDRYERRLCRLAPASQIRFVFSPVK